MNSLFRTSLPRLFVRKPIPAKTVNAAADATERSRVLPGVGSGLEVKQLPNGLAVRSLLGTLTILGQASGSITARSGTTAGSGTANLYYLSGTTLTAWSGSRTVYNLLNKTIASGSYIIAVLIGKDYWVVAVDDCTHLS